MVPQKSAPKGSKFFRSVNDPLVRQKTTTATTNTSDTKKHFSKSPPLLRVTPVLRVHTEQDSVRPSQQLLFRRNIKNKKT